MGIKNKQTFVRKPKKSSVKTGAVNSNETRNTLSNMTIPQRKDIFVKTVQARREALGALKAQMNNFQKAVNAILEIDDAILNMLGQDSPLTK